MNSLETVLMWVFGAIGAYFALAFIVSFIVVCCGFYFVWRITR